LNSQECRGACLFCLTDLWFTCSLYISSNVVLFLVWAQLKKAFQIAHFRHVSLLVYVVITVEPSYSNDLSSGVKHLYLGLL
jgi:hypothetical protein